MEHDATIEAIELAAVEPGGLDRLMAGDTETSRAVAAHLAGCDSCAATLVGVHRDALVIADVVATTPRPELRARTLALVRRSGAARGSDAEAGPVAAVETAAEPAAAVAEVPIQLTSATDAVPTAAAPSRTRRVNLGWVASIAATVLLSVGLTTVVVADRSQAEVAAQADTIDDLEHITSATMAVAAEPDATSVTLAGTTDGPALAGTLLFSPTSTDLVVVATGMTEPPADQEYMCWMDAGNGRVRIGKMFFGGDLAYWAGASEAIDGLDGPATFGVSLVDVGSPATDAEPVLLGQS